MVESVAIAKDSLALCRTGYMCTCFCGEWWLLGEEREPIPSLPTLLWTVFIPSAKYVSTFVVIYLIHLSMTQPGFLETPGLYFLVTAESEPSPFTDKAVLSMSVLSIKQAVNTAHCLVIFMRTVSAEN